MIVDILKARVALTNDKYKNLIKMLHQLEDSLKQIELNKLDTEHKIQKIERQLQAIEIQVLEDIERTVRK